MIGTWLGAALLRPDLRRDLVAVELGQHDVEQDQVGRLGAPQPEPFGAVARDDDVVALLLERVLQEALDVRVVVDDEDLGRHQSSTDHSGSARSCGWPRQRIDYRPPARAIIGPVLRPSARRRIRSPRNSNTSRLQVSSRSATAATSRPARRTSRSACRSRGSRPGGRRRRRRRPPRGGRDRPRSCRR